MAIQVFDGRVQLKYDSHANWLAANPVLLSGEPAFVFVPPLAGAVVQEPAMLFKIGDGTTAYADLPFGSGKAADVYDWAKAATKPAYTADEISGLADYIAGEIKDTDTTYKMEQDATDGHKINLYSKELGGDWVLQTTITTLDTVYDDTALAGRVSDVEALVGSTSVAAQVAAAIQALDLANTYDAKGAAEQALASAKAYTDEKVGAIVVPTKVSDLTNDSNFQTGTQVETAIQTAIAATGHASFETSDTVPTVAEAKDDVFYLVLNTTTGYYDIYAKVVNSQGAAEVVRLDDTTVNLSDYSTTEQVQAAIESAVANKVDKVAGKGLSTEDFTSALKTKLEGVAAGAQVNVLEGVQVNGTDLTITNKKVNVTVPTGALASKDTVAESDLTTALADKINAKADDADLAVVAKTGNVDDLIQTEGGYFIINCGSATTVI